MGLGCGGLRAAGDCPCTRELAYLCIGEAQHCSQLLSVRLGHILLNLKPLFQAFPLQVGEDRP